jgi:hypothetical protein
VSHLCIQLNRFFWDGLRMRRSFNEDEMRIIKVEIEIEARFLLCVVTQRRKNDRSGQEVKET